MDDVFLAGPVASVQVVVDELGFGVGAAQVLETDLLDFCRLNVCFGVSRSYCMGVLAFVWGTEAYNGEICDFFIES